MKKLPIVLASLIGLSAVGLGTASTVQFATNKTAEQPIDSKSYVVTFESNGGTHIDTQIINEGEKVKKPDPEPTKKDCTFLGWYLNREFKGEAYTFDTVLTENITLFANWEGGAPQPTTEYVYVTFETYGGTHYDSSKIEKGSTVNNPGTPIKDGYTFDAWFTDSSFAGTAYDFNTPVTSDITLYAKYTKNKVSYNFKFEGTNCTLEHEEKYEEGTELNDLTISPKNGYHLPEKINVVGPETFEYNSSNGKLSLTVTSNVTVICNAIQDDLLATYTVTFIMNGATSASIPSQTINDGAKATKPTEPTKTGHSFMGWYIKEVYDDVNKFNFNTEVHQDYILYACWGIDKYNISFYDGQTELPQLKQTVNYNDKVQRPEAPIKEHYVFDNWYINKSYEAPNLFNFDNPMTGNTKAVSIYAHYVEQEYRVTFNANGGYIPSASDSDFVNVKYGNSIPEDSVPFVQKAGYDSYEVEWYDALNGGNKYTFGENGTPITGPITLYARWGSIQEFTVIFIGMPISHLPVADDQIVQYNQRVIKPTIYDSQTYSIIEFYEDYELTKEFKFENPLTPKWNEDKIYIYVKMIKKTCKVTFIGNGGTIESGSVISVDCDGYVDQNLVPVATREGYNSADVTWHKDPNIDSPFIFSYPLVGDKVTSDLNLYAHWGPIKTYTVVFEGNGGSYLETTNPRVTRYNVAYNTMPLIPDAPINIDPTGVKAYTFVGYDKNVVPATGDESTITYTAQWEETTNAYTITLNATSNGEFPDSTDTKNIIVEAGSNLNEVVSALTKPLYKDANAVKIFDEYVYLDGTSISSSDVVNDDIELNAYYRKKTLEECSWYDIHTISSQGATFAESYFGPCTPYTGRQPLEKTIHVNGIDQKVRIMAYGEDFEDLNDKENTAIGITFEFVNVLCDSNGYSIAAYWNDAAQTTGSSNNYRDSTIRACLNGSFDNVYQGSTQSIEWFQYFGTDHDSDTNLQYSETYSGKSVLDMLPSDLRPFIRTTSKYINIYNEEKTPEAGWEEQTVGDRIFLLSPHEMISYERLTSEEPSTSSYSYFKDNFSSYRMKCQINKEIGARTSCLEGKLAGSKILPLFHPVCYSYAGFNSTESIDFSTQNYTPYWLRSPCAFDGGDGGGAYVLSVYYASSYFPNRYALPVAPCFCI